jgi:hypothetical protein
MLLMVNLLLAKMWLLRMDVITFLSYEFEQGSRNHEFS